MRDEHLAESGLFWPKVDRRGPDECWLWTAARLPAGYGIFHIKRQNRYAHRVAWALTYGPILDGLHILHACDNPPCVNPKHLFKGTAGDNRRDCVGKGRDTRWPRARGATHPNSKLTESNVKEIRRRVANGEAKKALAREFGVSDTLIRYVTTRRAWAYLP